MRTSTGSISVMKIIQNTSVRPGKRKYTMAKADSSEIAILPMAMTSALIRLTVIIGSGRLQPAAVLGLAAEQRELVALRACCSPGSSGIGTCCTICFAVCVLATKVR